MDSFHTLLTSLLAKIHVEGREVYWGNSINDYVLALVILIGGFFVVHFFQWLLLRWLGKIAKRTQTIIDDTFLKIIASFRPPFYAFFAFWLAVHSLVIEGVTSSVITGILIIWGIYQMVTAAGIFVEEVVFRKFTKDRNPTTRSALQLVTRVAKGLFWGFGIILLLSNLGVDVSSLIAGISISGIAIAFSLQNILADIFSAFVLYFDRPFDVGDYITVGGNSGSVTHIGLRSTRMRAASGEEVSIPNQDIAKARVQNFKRMRERRIVFTFTVHQETPYEKLCKVSDMVTDIVQHTENARLERVHFSAFAPAAFVFEVVYIITVPDYITYMNIQQWINLKVVERLQANEIRFV